MTLQDILSHPRASQGILLAKLIHAKLPVVKGETLGWYLWKHWGIDGQASNWRKPTTKHLCMNCKTVIRSELPLPLQLLTSCTSCSDDCALFKWRKSPVYYNVWMTIQCSDPEVTTLAIEYIDYENNRVNTESTKATSTSTACST